MIETTKLARGVVLRYDTGTTPPTATLSCCPSTKEQHYFNMVGGVMVVTCGECGHCYEQAEASEHEPDQA